MTTLTKLRNAWGSPIDYSPFRWIMLLLAATTIIGTAAYSYRKIDSELTVVALSRREAVAQLMASILTEKFGRLIDIGVSLSTRVQFRNLVAAGKWDKAIAILHDVPQDFPQIERLTLIDTQGTLRADVPALPGVLGGNFASREWFQGVSHDWRPYVSAVYTRQGTPQLNVVMIAVPVKNQNGRVTGILGLQIRIENILEQLSKIANSEETFIYFVDSKGQRAFNSRRPDLGKILDLSATPIVQKLQRGEQGMEIGYDAIEQEQSIFAYAPVPDYGWGVVVQQPVRASIGLIARDAQLRQLLAGYGLILLLAVMTAILALRITSARQKTESDRQMKVDLERRVLERTTELTAANKELEAFSYSVSHDLRTPLRAIDGFSQVLLDDYADRLDDQARNYLGRVRAATQRMGNLIDDMLTLSRITRAEMQRETVDLSALATEVFAELQASEPERKVDVRIEPGLVAKGDSQLLRVALVNLLGNSWKFTGKTVNAKIEFGAIRNADGTTDFFVRDNGVGFDMTYADKLFGAFQRLHLASEFPGTGIGLATVQRIIRRHGGQTRGEAVPGQGATFNFTLPG